MVLKVGIVSAAWGGYAHLPAWRAVPGVEVTAICTSRRETAEAAAARLEIARPFWDAEAMCADPDIDIVDCGTRPNLRLPMILAALRNGKHVYNACPHAPDWAGALQIDTAWRASGAVGVVDAFSQWLPAHRHMATLLDEGFIGRPLGGTCHLDISLFNQPDKRFPYNWFAQAGQGVSAVRNNGSHALYMLLHLFGPVTELVADDRRVLDEWAFPDGERIASATNDCADVILRFAAGFTMTLRASWSLPLHDGWLLDIYGDKGRLTARSPTFPTARDCTLRGGRLGKAMADIEIPGGYLGAEGIALDWQTAIQPSFPMALSMQAMVGQINGRGDRAGQAGPDFARALEVERVQEAICRSSLGRCWIKVGDLE